MGEDANAAIRRFPDRSRAISDLFVRDEGFRDMCTDFATAEAELQRWRASEDPRRERRIDEYLVLVEDLAAEIANTLDATSFAPFSK